MATEILRPSAAGDETVIPTQFPVSGAHWDKVDEASQDSNSTYVQNTIFNYKRDLYNLPVSSGVGTINFIKVYFCIYSSGNTTYAQPSIKSGATVTDGTEVARTLATYETFSQQWNTNPATEAAYTRAEIDALQIGINLKSANAVDARCTQVYVEVDYTPVVAPTVATQAVSSIGTTTATGNGNITATGGEDASAWGVCVAETENPDTGGTVFAGSGAGGTGAFTASMTSLSQGTHYYVRAYATNSAGTSYGAQVEFTTNKDATGSDTGSGADAKVSGNPLATFPVRSETGGGVDGHKAVAPQSAGETGSGVDALTALLGILARSETGLGTDAKLSLLATLIKADAGSGVEHILDRALVLISESGTGLDVSHLIKTLLLSDSGSAVENSYLHILEGVKSSSDTGSGAEASTLAALFQRAEAGVGAEAVVARALYTKEYPTGAIDLAKVLTATITGTGETGTGVEASLVAFYQKKSDSGAGVDAHKAVSPLSEGDSGAGVDSYKELSPISEGDAGSGVDAHKELSPISEGDSGTGADVSSLIAMFSGSDTGSGAEAITLLAAMVAQDTGQSVESVLNFFRKLIDSGQGEENLYLVGFVGRAMKLVTYLRAYSDLRVYTKPYSDLRVYTSETRL